MSILYAAEVRVKGGRSGHAESTDGHLKVDLAAPGSNSKATNPEQLFAAGYGACFESALRQVAKQKNLPLKDASVLATVNLHKSEEKGYYLSAALAVEIEGISQQEAQEVVETAHTLCPYSKAIHGNVDVKLSAKAK